MDTGAQPRIREQALGSGSLRSRHGFELTIEPMLLEEAVFREVVRLEGSGDAATANEYLAARDSVLGGEAASQLREQQLLGLHHDWFRRLGLLGLLQRALGELADPGHRLTHAFAQRAASGRDEGADLHGGGDSRPPTLVLRLRPEAFGNPDGLLRLLRRDLLYVADMIDPGFGYERDLPHDIEGPLRKLVGDRYGVLWALAVSARLSRRWGYPAISDPQQLLARVFPAAPQSALAHLSHAALGPEPLGHARLIEWARG